MTVVTVEYPGYGVNKTELTHNSIFETCEHFVDYFRTGKYETVPLYLYMHVNSLIVDMDIPWAVFLPSTLLPNTPVFVVSYFKVRFQPFREYSETSAVQSELGTNGGDLTVRNI